MSHPNIVFVFGDQHRLCTTGFGGNAQVRSPYMDQMAEEGVVFETTVSNVPVCTPWRAAFLTGQYPLTTGMFMNDVQLPTDRPTFGTVLRDAGYDTAYIGKWHLGYDVKYIPVHHGFDEFRGFVSEIGRAHV